MRMIYTLLFYILSFNLLAQPTAGQLTRIQAELPNGTFGVLKSNADNQLHVQTFGVQSDSDSVPLRADGIATDIGGSSVKSIAALGAGATYTSGWVDTDGFKAIELIISTDQLSASNGIIVEYTDDVDSPTVRLDKVFTYDQHAVNNGDLNIFVPTRLDGFRVKYTNGAIAQGSFFLEVTLRTSRVQPVSVSVTSPIVADTNADVTRSVIAGQIDDSEGVQTDMFGNVELTNNNAIKTAIPSGELFRKATPDDATLPTGAAITIHPTLNTESNVIDSGWIGRAAYNNQLFNAVTFCQLDVYLLNASDELGNNMFGQAAPALSTNGSGVATQGARLFDRYFRIVIVNDSGAACTAYSVRSEGTQVAGQPFDLAMNQTVFDFFPAPITQSAIRTYNEPAGTLDLLQSSPSGSMQVAITDRPSEVRSRTHFHLVVDAFTIGATQTVHYTVPVGQTLYLHSVVVQFLNDQNQSAVWSLRDSTSAVITFLASAKNVGGNAGVAFASPSLPEPLKIQTNLNSIRTSIQGTLEGTITFVGYLEPD